MLSLLTSLLLVAADAAPPAAGAEGPPLDPEAGGIPAEDPVLAEVRTLARAGAHDLALDVLTRSQPSYGIDPVRWLRFEDERLRLLRQRGRWDEILATTGEVPGELDPAFRARLTAARAAALTAVGRPDEALVALRDRLWLDGELGGDARRELRRSLISGYQADGQLEAARTALIRHRQDYPEEAEALRPLQARLYLLSAAPQDALASLEPLPGSEDAAALVALAALRAGARSPSTALSEAVGRATTQARRELDRQRDWLIAAEAASMVGNHAAELSALERALALIGPGDVPDPVFRASADQLWSAYLRIGLLLGNRAHLVQGDDLAWVELAEAALTSDPVAVRALLGFLAHRAFDPEIRSGALEQLGEQLWLEPWGPDAAYHLFLEAELLPDPATLPYALRYRLVDLVLARGEVALASRLMADLTAPPQGTDLAEWTLRRSRVLILGGHPEAAVEGLAALVVRPGSVALDRLLQPLFDLQAVEMHEPAAALLGGLLRWPMEDQQRRELLYWIADSQRALGVMQEAARLYLASATLADPFAMDPWAQTARFQAAEVLAEDGQVEDARSLYQGLLNATQDPARRALLRQKLQALLLRDDDRSDDAGAPIP